MACPVKKGDTVTLAVNPNIEISQYFRIKPYASLTRIIGDNPEEELKAIHNDLNTLALQAVLQELKLDDVLQVIVAEGGWEALEEFCRKEIANVTPQQTLTETENKSVGTSSRTRISSTPQSVKAPVRKAR